MAVYGVEDSTFRKVDKRCIESTEMRRWRRMEKISFTDCVKDEGLRIDKEERNIQQAMERRKAYLIGLIFLRNWLLKHVI
jgi:endonuclease V-like protein UPF0215 family